VLAAGVGVRLLLLHLLLLLLRHLNHLAQKRTRKAASSTSYRTVLFLGHVSAVSIL
jgi:hypothetical protein